MTWTTREHPTYTEHCLWGADGAIAGYVLESKGSKRVNAWTSAHHDAFSREYMTIDQAKAGLMEHLEGARRRGRAGNIAMGLSRTDWVYAGVIGVLCAVVYLVLRGVQ